MERRHREPSCVGNRFAACVVRNVAHFRSVWAIRLQHLFAFDCRKADSCVACAGRLHEAGGCGVAGSSRRSAPRGPRDSRGPSAAKVPVTAVHRQNEGQYQGPRRFPPQYSTLLRRFPRVGMLETQLNTIFTIAPRRKGAGRGSVWHVSNGIQTASHM